MPWFARTTIVGLFVLAPRVALWAAPARGTAQGTCELDARNRQDVPMPAIGREAMGPQLAEAVRRGFELVAVRYESAKAERVFRRAIEASVAEDSRCGEALATFGMAQAVRNLRMPESVALFRHSGELFETLDAPMALAQVHQRIASTEYLLGDQEAYVRDGAGVPAEFTRAGDEASALAERSLEAGLRAGAVQPEELEGLWGEIQAVHTPNAVGARGAIQFQWADSLRAAGKFREAMEHYRVAVGELKRCECSPQTMGSAYLDMALIASKQDDATATLAYARKGDEVYARANLEPYRPRSLRTVGTAYMQLHAYARAIQTYRQALTLARTEHADFTVPGIASMLAQAYGWDGRPLLGIEILDETSIRPLTASERCTYDTTKAELQMDAKQYAKADALIRHSAETCGELLSILDAACLEYVFSQAEMHLGRMDEALLHGRRAVEEIEQQRTLLSRTDQNMSGFNENHVRYYDGLIEVLTRMHRGEEALLVSEEFRGRPFLDLLRSQRTPEEAVAASAGPRTVLSSFQTLPQGVATVDEDGRFSLKSEAHPFELTMSDIRRSVEREHSTLVSYWMGSGRLYTWVVAPGKAVYAASAPVRQSEVASLVKATLPTWRANGRGVRGLRRGSREDALAIAGRARRPWRELYRMLIAPVAAQLPQESGSLLTIVPQGSLFALSFPALIDGEGRYLIERYAVHTVPAAGLLQVTESNDMRAAKFPVRYVLVASPASFPRVGGRVLPALPGAEAEVRGILRHLHGESAMLLDGKDAGIDSLIRSLPQATMLHVATHAVVRDDAPLTSYLALDRGQRGGVLTAAFVYGLHMHVRLVVLSACSTGRGKISGDGVAGLSRAFIYAGAASLVTTFWDVADEPTAQMMPRFYEGMVQGQSRSAALREAQLSLIRDLRGGRIRVKTLAGGSQALPEEPAYWAAFSLSGEP